MCEPQPFTTSNICLRRYLNRYRVMISPCVSVVSIQIPKYLGSYLSGVECRDTPGAQHRTGTCGLHEGFRGRNSLGITGLARRLHGLLNRLRRSTILLCAADTKALNNAGGFGSSQELLEVAVLGENICQGLVQDLIG